MRTLAKNKQKMYYALYKGEEPEYILDDDGNKIISYVDDDGTIYYEETGRNIPTYYEPVPFDGNFATSDSGEAKVRPYGIDVSGYDALLVMDKNEIPIDETSLIWKESEPKYKDIGKTILDTNSADYTVAKDKPSLNQSIYLLNKIVK